jgi:Sigma-70, region 4
MSNRASAARAQNFLGTTVPAAPAAIVHLRRYPDVAECVDSGPPGAGCSRTDCRYHLANRGYWEHHLRPTRDCSLDVANEGPHTLDEVAAVLGVSGERVRQIEEEAIEHLKHNATLKRLHDESPE